MIKASLARIEYLLSLSFIDKGYWYKGLALLEESLAIYRQLDNLEGRADTIYHIARTHHLMLNLDKARMYYRDARRLYQHIGEEPGIAACHTGLGRLMLRLGFVDDALAELTQASQIYTQLENKERLEEVQEVIALGKQVKEKQHEPTRFPLG